MVERKDALTGEEGVWNKLNSEVLLNKDLDSSLDIEPIDSDDRKINESINFFLTITPLEFSDQDFVAATRKLNGEEFAKAVYRVYLRRDCEHQKVDYGTGVLMRLSTLSNFRRSKEFNHIWSAQIDQAKRKKVIHYFLEKIWIKITG